MQIAWSEQQDPDDWTPRGFCAARYPSQRMFTFDDGSVAAVNWRRSKRLVRKNRGKPVEVVMKDGMITEVVSITTPRHT